MKRSFIMFFALLCCLFSFNRGYSQDSIAKHNFSYGVKMNTNLIYAVKEGGGGENKLVFDYSLYLLIKNIGVLGGYSSFYNSYGFNLKGFHAGIILNLLEHKHSSINVYMYDIHYSFYAPYCYTCQTLDVPYLINNNNNNRVIARSDMVFFNPRYKYTFLKDVLAVEYGLAFLFVLDTAEPGFSQSISLSFNPSILFKRNTSLKK